MPSLTAVATTRDDAAKARMVDGVFRRTGEIGFGVANPKMADALTHGIARMVATGHYDRLRQEHGLPLDLSPYRP